MESSNRLIAVVGLTLLPITISAQQPISLGKPDAEFSEPFTQIRTIRELSDGRVLVVDPRDRIVQLVDFKAGIATKVGRTGAGPGEYGLPDRIIALPGDSSAIFDPDNSRCLIITPDFAHPSVPSWAVTRATISPSPVNVWCTNWN